ncbi:MAG: aconitate hydratase AcnA [Phycisphaerales bacterium]
MPGPFESKSTLKTDAGAFTYFALGALSRQGIGHVERLPYSIKVLLEACLRNVDGFVVTEEDVKAIANYDAKSVGDTEIPFMPGRVVLQDFTGVPAVVDLAALRSAMSRMDGDPQKVNPLVPCDLVIDHSVQVDAFNSGIALTINSEKEFERNLERYELLKWAQGAFNNFRVVPPATGIVHQVNLEYLGKVVWERDGVLYPDSLVGTDSHTTMINGLGIVGWGVGGIEAEAVMLGQPIYMLLPEVVGMRLVGELPPGATATDLVLRVTEILRSHGVVGKFVEFYGPAMAKLRLADRATIANMAPEYGATMGFFPVDDQTLKYMKLTGRPTELIQTVEKYARAQGLWRDESHEIEYSATIELDLATVVPSISGPKRPQDRIALTDSQTQWRRELVDTFGKPHPGEVTTSNHWADEGGQPLGQAAPVAVAIDPNVEGVEVEYDGETFRLQNGHVVIAAITSCTNTSNPSVMIGAGLVARNAAARGLRRQPWVKTSLAPGSKVVTEYLNESGLMDDLEQLGFYLVGYGCTTCIGNSGPLPDPISKAINEHDLVACSVLSGNRNFEGRISPDVRANYLASPPLVVAYAIAGTMDIDFAVDPIGRDDEGNDVFLKDIWPSAEEINAAVNKFVTREQFTREYAEVFKGSDEWREIDAGGGAKYEWNSESTYVQEPPFFVDMPVDPPAIEPIKAARCLVKVGDSVTTDHISPAGSIPADGPAGKYLIEHGVPISMFNSFGSRRGNHEVMMRGTFANIRVRNQLAPGTEGGYTTDFLDGEVKSIYDASMHYQAEGIPLVVLAGKDYGMGSSRDWAAKGTYLLGVAAVIAESYERIHRSNLVGMGVLPLTFEPGVTVKSLGLDGTESFDIQVDDQLKPKERVHVVATKADGSSIEFDTICRIDTPVEVEYYRNGGILHTVLRKMAKS